MSSTCALIFVSKRSFSVKILLWVPLEKYPMLGMDLPNDLDDGARVNALYYTLIWP